MYDKLYKMIGEMGYRVERWTLCDALEIEVNEEKEDKIWT